MLRGLIAVILALPYTWRVPVLGWIMANIIGPIAQYKRRALQQLAHAWPDMDAAERTRIAKRALDNMGRTFAENYSGAQFRERQAGLPFTGPGAEKVFAALDQNKPVLFASAHYGNYEAMRARMQGRGIKVGAMYRAASNPYFDKHYLPTIEEMGGPLYEKGKRGTARFMRDLRKGQPQLLMFDLYVVEGILLPFMGQPAPTSVAAARMAQSCEALLVPFYGIRQPDGLSFDVVFENPIAHGSVEDMTLALNKSLEAQLTRDPTQWIWAHRRWKPNRKRRPTQRS